MKLFLLLMLHFGTPQWDFPWWLWALVILFEVAELIGAMAKWWEQSP